jgi:hypothetical protein
MDINSNSMYKQALHICMMRVAAEVKHFGFVAASNNTSGIVIPGQSTQHQHAGGASGVGAVVNSLYSGGASTAANIYSSLQDASSGMMGSNTALGTGTSASVGVAAASRSLDLLKTPMPMRDAAPDNMYALNERIVAAESCWFVAKVINMS